MLDVKEIHVSMQQNNAMVCAQINLQSVISMMCRLEMSSYPTNHIVYNLYVDPCMMVKILNTISGQ